MRSHAKEQAGIAAHKVDDWAHTHKALCAAFIAFALGSMALVGLGLSLSPHDLIMARQWRDQQWRHQTCTIEDVGIAYRGTCGTDVELMMTDSSHFRECRGPAESTETESKERKIWNAMPAGRCAKMGDKDFWYDTEHYDKPKDDPAELEIQEEEELGTERRLFENAFMSAAPRLLFRPKLRITSQTVNSGPGRLCHNGYLLWAAVNVLIINSTSPSSTAIAIPNASHGCAFEYGASAPSVTADWAAVTAMRTWLQSARELDCWVLDDDACVIAFHSGQVMLDAKGEEYKNMKRGATCCGILSFFFLMVAAYWRAQDKYGPCFCQDTTFSALPTQDPNELDESSPAVGQLAASSELAMSFATDSAGLSAQRIALRTASLDSCGSGKVSRERSFSRPSSRSASKPFSSEKSSGEARMEVPAGPTHAKGGRRVSIADIALAEMTGSAGAGASPEVDKSNSYGHLTTAARPSRSLRASTC